MPQAPEFMSGVINLRGAVVPVIDLKRKFGIKGTERTLDTRIIIGEVSIEGDGTVLGVIADAVNEVMELEPESIEAAPQDRHEDEHGIHQGHGQARGGIHHDPRHRQGVLGPGDLEHHEQQLKTDHE
jgi:chemotaxis signal transduction protein